MKRLLLTSVISGLLISSCNGNGNHNENAGGGSTQEKTLVALIFCDVTNSLTKEENRRVGSLAADVLESLPRGAIYKLYPIQIQTQTLAPIHLDLAGNNQVDEEDYQVVPEAPDSTKLRQYEEMARRQREKWRGLIQKGVDELYDRLNKGDDNRTCILNALDFASNYVRTNYGDPERFDVRMFLISDMVEECNETPLGGRVDMGKRDISAEIQRARDFQAGHPQNDNSQPQATRPKCNLDGVNIYCVFPAASDTPNVPGGRRPNRNDVKVFWGEIFRSCGNGGGHHSGFQVAWVDSGDLTELLRKLRPAG